MNTVSFDTFFINERRGDVKKCACEYAERIAGYLLEHTCIIYIYIEVEQWN